MIADTHYDIAQMIELAKIQAQTNSELEYRQCQAANLPTLCLLWMGKE